MIQHIDYLANDREVRDNPSGHGSLVSMPRPATTRANEGALSDEDLETVTGPRSRAAKCPCGKQHHWGGPVCGECFVAAPERVQSDYLIGTLDQRQAASRWLAGLALLRAAGLALV